MDVSEFYELEHEMNNRKKQLNMMTDDEICFYISDKIEYEMHYILIFDRLLLDEYIESPSSKIYYEGDSFESLKAMRTQFKSDQDYYNDILLRYVALYYLCDEGINLENGYSLLCTYLVLILHDLNREQIDNQSKVTH